MTGILERLLTKRYQKPTAFHSNSGVEYRWNDQDERLASVLYKDFPGLHGPKKGSQSLDDVYADALGGYLLGGSLKVAIRRGPKVYSLYLIEELQNQPEVHRANSLDPEICFFMDSANVWFYGLKNGQLYVYDSGTDELDTLGAVESALEVLLSEWEEAKRR